MYVLCKWLFLKKICAFGFNFMIGVNDSAPGFNLLIGVKICAFGFNVMKGVTFFESR